MGVTDLDFVKKFTQARFFRWKFYPKERKLRQMPNCDKTAKNMSGQTSKYMFINAAIHLITPINHIYHNNLAE